MKNKTGLQSAKRLMLIQSGLTIVIAMIVWIALGPKAAVSAVLGGLVSTIPNVVFAKKLFQFHGAQAAKQIVNGFYKGEVLKMVLSVALFSLVFICFNVIPLVFFAVYIGIQMVIWFAPLIFNFKVKK